MKKRSIKLLTILMMATAFVVFGAGQAFAADIVDHGNCGAAGNNVTWTLDSDGVLTISGQGAMEDYDYYRTKGSYSQYCNDIQEVVFEEGVTSVGNNAFRALDVHYSSLKRLTLSNTIERIGVCAFNRCGAIEGKLIIPGNVKKIEQGAFYQISITELVLEDGVAEIETGAFDSATLLGDLTIPGSVKRIGDVAFQGLGINAEQKGSLTIENGVEEIGNAAFNSSVFSMEDLVIPDSVRVIGSQAFSCDGIEGAICIPDSVYEIGENAFSYAGSLHDDFYVVKGSAAEDYLLEQYQNCDIHYLYEPAERPPLKVKYLNFNTDTINVELNSTVRISDYIASTEAADDFDVQIDDENIAIYDDATGRIVGLEPGETQITVSGNQMTDSAAVRVLAASEMSDLQTLSFVSDSISLTKGHSVSNHVVFNPADARPQELEWTSSEEAVVSVDNGVITGVNNGTATVSARCKANPSIAAQYDVEVLGYREAETIIALPNASAYAMKKGQTKELPYYIYPSDATNRGYITFESSAPEIITISDKGRMTAVDSGTATITARIGELEQTFQIVATQPLKGITLSETKATMYKGQTKELTVTYNPEDTTDDKTVSWSSSNESVVSVEDGVLTCHKKGYAVITATVGAFSEQCEVVCREKPLEGISLDRDRTAVVIDGEPEMLTVIYEPADTTDDKTVTWTSDQPDVVSVSSGEVSGLAEGEAVVTATVGEFSASCTVASGLTAPLMGVTLNESEKTMTLGEETQLVASLNPTNTTDDKTITWTSSDSDVAEVTDDGKVTALKSGMTTITATAGEFTAECAVEVKKLTPEYDVPQGLETSCNKKLSSIELPTGFEWEDADASVGTVGDKLFPARFTPENTVQYETVENIQIPVTVSHDFSGEYVFDASRHWHECGCEEKRDIDNHTFDWKVIEEPTCEREGTEVSYCIVCGMVEEPNIRPVPTAPHNYGEWTTTKDASCTETGSRARSCSVCGDIDVETIPLLPHQWGGYVVDVPPTHSQEGSESIHCEICGASDKDSIRSVPKPSNHDLGEWIIETEATCTEDGVQKRYCNTCGEWETEPIPAHHRWSGEYTVDEAATYDKAGSESIHCVVCGAVNEESRKVIPALPKTSIKGATVSGLKTKVYTGKALTQAPVVKKGTVKLTAGKDYTVSYKSNKNVGRASVVITGKTKYKDSITVYFNINPKGTSLSRLSAVKKGFTAKWKKQATQTNGYQIRYSLKSSMASSKTVTITKAATVSKKITKLKAKKKYYVQVRTYKTVNGKKWYSAWSAKKAVTTKK